MSSLNNAPLHLATEFQFRLCGFKGAVLMLTGLTRRAFSFLPPHLLRLFSFNISKRWLHERHVDEQTQKRTYMQHPCWVWVTKRWVGSNTMNLNVFLISFCFSFHIFSPTMRLMFFPSDAWMKAMGVDMYFVIFGRNRAMLLVCS
jgi:hypothetical protein